MTSSSLILKAALRYVHLGGQSLAASVACLSSADCLRGRIVVHCPTRSGMASARSAEQTGSMMRSSTGTSDCSTGVPLPILRSPRSGTLHRCCSRRCAFVCSTASTLLYHVLCLSVFCCLQVPQHLLPQQLRREGIPICATLDSQGMLLDIDASYPPQLHHRPITNTCLRL
jgi:hypothetical protein